MAENRLKSLSKRLASNEALCEKYTEAILGNVKKGYAEEVPQEEVKRDDGRVWYVPHHAVTHPRKPDKIRIVFDCAATYSGVSLNKVVNQGPDLTNKLTDVLMRFRQGPIAFMADVEAMFSQVKVERSDRDVLRFLWFADNDPRSAADPVTYRMTSHLFGGVWCPSVASYALQKCANDLSPIFDVNTSLTIKQNFYVDDCLKATNTVEEAVRLAKELRDMLGQCGFNLTKWISNCPEVLQAVPPAHRAEGVTSLALKSGSSVERALGVLWDLNSDCFSYDINLKESPFTKRGILSTVSSVYDPLGFAGPCVIRGKACFQATCREQMEWDDLVPDGLADQWKEWVRDLPTLSTFKVPRCLSDTTRSTHPVKLQLHHFSDASELGYGAVSYLRSEDATGKVDCALVMSKNRLAPLKTMTIPRLELSAAVVAAQLDQTIKRCFEAELQDSVFWTDSMIVLHYLKNEEKRFQTFVANRVSKILGCTNASQWRHVGTLDNPADDLSRGLSAKDLIQNERWLKGPSFLWRAESLWPKQPELGPLPSDAETKRVPKVFAVEKDLPSLDWFFERYSSWYKLKRAVVYILRIKTLLRGTLEGKLSDKITLAELKKAEIAIIEYLQRKVLTNSNIKKLCPIKLEDGVLRVGGRLLHAPITEDAKHPIILPAHHHVSKLIAWHYHLMTAHGSVERVLAECRQSFWIIKGRATIKRVLHKCLPCKRVKAPLSCQKMSNLPADRVIPGEPPFSRVGVDYFGPLMVKRARSQEKRYGCLFTCLATRAIHLEVAFSLDTDSFLRALERFTSRRGRPLVIRSDNGTNFVGGQRELKTLLNEWNQAKIESHLLEREIQWIFNPPAASHMGGVWERQIRTVRSILTNLVGQQILTDEKLATLFCMTEGIVNGRPITKFSDDPMDSKPLTPNDLLLRRSNNVLAQGMFVKQDALRQSWKQAQYLANVFWSRWLKEYLPALQERQKWLVPQRNFKPGDLVLLLHENTPRSHWPLALIMDVNLGPDGLVRSAQVKTTSGTYVRPVHKLCLLEANLE
jgi:hypothetical protein